MTQEEKQLLLIDLCARLPYGVKAEVMGWDEEKGEEVFVPVTVYSVNTDGYVYFADNDYDITYYSIDACRLYLRPLSSMTEKEKEEMKEVIEIELTALEGPEGFSVATAASSAFEIDFYNKHHLDYRGLIEKGLVLEAPQGMYKTE